ncbi:MAG: FFLEELY motif protein [Lysobacteraceae bacterium]
MKTVTPGKAFAGRRLDRRSLGAALTRRLAWHQALHDPEREPRNDLHWLPELRRWQAARLSASFEGFMSDPKRRPAAEFFLTDLYGDRDFSRRDADIARVAPMMLRLMPQSLVETLADAIELGALSHAFDLRMAEALERIAPRRKVLDDDLYARAYREVGLPRLRAHQIDLIVVAGVGLGHALRTRGVATLLAMLRGPARAAGFGELQSFLERGFGAYGELDDVEDFLADIERSEREVSRRLFAGEPQPFAPLPDAHPSGARRTRRGKR